MIKLGAVEDHVHILGRLNRSTTQAEWVKELKRASSIWLNQRGLTRSEFSWQRGYGAFSAGRSDIETLCRYIENQEQHHSKTSFQDEYRQLLMENGIDWDERYVWD